MERPQKWDNVLCIIMLLYIAWKYQSATLGDTYVTIQLDKAAMLLCEVSYHPVITNCGQATQTGRFNRCKCYTGVLTY